MRLNSRILLGPMIASLVLLNAYFAWTSHALDGLPTLKNAIGVFAAIQVDLSGTSSWFSQSAASFCSSVQQSCSVPDVALREFIDSETLTLVGMVGVSAYLYFNGEGRVRALARALQMVSLALVPLGLEILIFDFREFGIHVSVAQQSLGILPWFSNEDLLILSATVFLTTSAFSMSEAQWEKISTAPGRLLGSRLSRPGVALACAGILAAAVALVRFVQVTATGSSIWDTFAFLDNARLLSLAPSNFPYDNTRPPLVSILDSFVFEVAHPTIASGYFVSAALFAVAGVGCYLLARQVMSQWLSVICALTFMASPFVYFWAGISLSNVEGVGVASLGLALLVMAANGKPKLFLLGIPLLVAAPFVRYTMGLVIPLAIVYLAANRKGVRLRNRFFFFGIVLAALTGCALYEVWVGHLSSGGVGPLFPAPDVANPTDYWAFLTAIPNSVGAYGSVLLVLMFAGVGVIAASLARRRKVNPLVLTLLLWSGLLLCYYTLFWPDKGSFDVTRYSTEFVMPLFIVAFWTIREGLEALSRLHLSVSWKRAAAVGVLCLLAVTEIGSVQTISAGASGGTADSALATGMSQVATWMQANVSPVNHRLLCTEYVLCWWYLPNYSVTGSEDLQEVETLTPSFSYLIYNKAQFGEVMPNVTDTAPVWTSPVGGYTIYKIGNGTALAQTYFSYTVQRGDTLSKIGQTFDASWQDIAYANDLSAPYRIFPGQSLSIPLNNPACLNSGITLPADDAKANQTYGAPAYANETGVNPDKRVIIRFDDGYQDVWTNALPVLAKYGYHAVFAIIDSYQGTTSVCTPYESYQQAYYMNWAEVQWLDQNGNEISDHTFTHPDLNLMSSAQLTQEIVYSKELFVQHGIDPATLTLPYGDGYGNQTVMSYILAHGFSYVFTVEGVEHTNEAVYPYSGTNVTWNDVDISDNQSLATFESIVNQAGPTNVVGLTFHSIGNDALNDTYETNTPNFAADMAYLHQNGFDVILPWQLPDINLSAGR